MVINFELRHLFILQLYITGICHCCLRKFIKISTFFIISYCELQRNFSRSLASIEHER